MVVPGFKFMLSLTNSINDTKKVKKKRAEAKAVCVFGFLVFHHGFLVSNKFSDLLQIDTWYTVSKTVHISPQMFPLEVPIPIENENF